MRPRPGVYLALYTTPFFKTVPSPGSRPGCPKGRAGALLAWIARTGALGARVAVSSLSSFTRRPPHRGRVRDQGGHAVVRRRSRPPRDRQRRPERHIASLCDKGRPHPFVAAEPCPNRRLELWNVLRSLGCRRGHPPPPDLRCSPELKLWLRLMGDGLGDQDARIPKLRSALLYSAARSVRGRRRASPGRPLPY